MTTSASSESSTQPSPNATMSVEEMKCELSAPESPCGSKRTGPGTVFGATAMPSVSLMYRM